MPSLKRARLLGAAALLGLFALAAAAQQAPAPEQSPPAEKPPMAKPEPVPQTTPTPSQAKSPHPLLGLTTVASDRSKIGDVRAVMTTPDGKITALHVHSGGFLGFGGKIVEVPEGKFTLKGNNVQLGLTAEEVSKLPAVKDMK